MKSTSKILPAIAMLVVSAVMLTTASFAWLAMNSSVTVSGMQANVKSESVYLLVSSVSTTDAELTAEQVQTSNAISVNGTALDGHTTTVLPSAHHATTGEAFKTVGNWYYGEGTSASDGTIKGAEIPLTTFENYVVRYKFYVTLAAGSPEQANLKVTEFSLTDSNGSDDITDISPVKVVIACGDQKEEFVAGQSTGTVDLTGDGSVTDATALAVWVYVYYDGNHANVTTNNLASLAGVNLSFKLLAN